MLQSKMGCKCNSKLQQTETHYFKQSSASSTGKLHDAGIETWLHLELNISL